MSNDNILDITNILKQNKMKREQGLMSTKDELQKSLIIHNALVEFIRTTKISLDQLVDIEVKLKDYIEELKSKMST